MTGFLIGLMVGATLGFLIAGICQAAKDSP